jgi:hypothetical protein
MTCNYMMTDIQRTLLALSFCPLVFYMPGYVAGAVSNVLDFNQQGFGFKSLVAICFSIAIFPAIVFILGMSLGLTTALMGYGVIGILFVYYFGTAALQASRQHKTKGERAKAVKEFRFGVLACLLWGAISLFSLIDWQTAPDELYPPVEVHDYTKHIVVTDAITRTGLPPTSPMFGIPNAPKLFYYYYWFMLCSFVEQTSRGLLEPRYAVLAGDIVTGFALLAAIALSARYLLPADENDSWQTAKFACALTLVTGLDILPVGLSHILQNGKHQLPIFASVEWWNDYIENFTHFALWVPHHVAGLVSCLIGTILLRRFQETGERPLWMLSLAALAFASAIGLSIYVSLTFALGWCIWILICLVSKKTDRILYVACAGLATALISLPFVATLVKANHSHAKQIAFTIRRFIFGETLVNQFIPAAFLNRWTTALEHLLFLPLNYCMEFGFFAVGAYLYFRTREKISQRDWFLLTLFGASLLIGTFLRSAVRNNDLGIRSIAVAQLAMLLWSARLLWQHLTGRLIRPLAQRQIKLLYVMLVLGFAGVVYDLYILRVADQIGMRRAYDAGVEDGKRNFYARDLYEHLDKVLTRDANVQQNPIHTLEAYDGSYGRRQVILFDRHYGTLMGVSPEMYAPVEQDIAKIFSTDELADVKACATKYNIDALIVKENDPIWNNPASWMSQIKPSYQNEGARLYILNPSKRL